MDIIISNSSGKPPYEQKIGQIKKMIISGELKPGEMLPSMRYLAKELRISVITTKRAYEELEREGFITTVQGKGSFVSEHNMELIREQQLRLVEQYLEQAVAAAKQAGISQEEMVTIVEVYYQEGDH